MESQASEFLTTVSPKRGRRSFKVFFGTLLGFAIALHLIPDEPVLETFKPRVKTTKRVKIPIWTWKALIAGEPSEVLSPLVGDTAFQNAADQKVASHAVSAQSRVASVTGTVLSSIRTTYQDAKEALSRIAKSESDRFANQAFKRAKNSPQSSQVMEGARVPASVALLGATLATGRSMRVRIGEDTAVRAQVHDIGYGRDYRVQVEREIPGTGTSLSSAVGSNSGLSQFSVRQKITDGWNVGVDRTRGAPNTSAVDRTEHAVSVGFTSNF